MPREDNARYLRPSKREYYLSLALEAARRSTCMVRKYGCIIVSPDDRIIATGYNGSPAGYINCIDARKCRRGNAPRYTDYENCVSVHAEQNALTMADFAKMKGGTIYLACLEWSDESLSWQIDRNPLPCYICRKMLQNSGLSTFANNSCEIPVNDLGGSHA